VACFYVREDNGPKQYYRAVYLLSRTVKDLVNGIADKFDIDANRVTRVTHVNARGLHIIIDEDVVRELPEGQDMVVEFAPFQAEDSIKHDFGQSISTDVLLDGDFPHPDTTTSDLLEMWLNY